MTPRIPYRPTVLSALALLFIAAPARAQTWQKVSPGGGGGGGLEVGDSHAGGIFAGYTGDASYNVYELIAAPRDAPNLYNYDWSPAVSYCNSLSANGYSDWYLPDLGELDTLYENQGAIGGFFTGWYWSSTEHDTSRAYRKSFGSGSPDNMEKDFSYSVRCVRRN